MGNSKDGGFGPKCNEKAQDTFTVLYEIQNFEGKKIHKGWI